MDLALEIIARLAVPFEADFHVIEIMETGERADHRAIGRCPLCRLHAGEHAVPQHPPIDEIHDVEGGTDNRVILAQRKRLGDRIAHRMECRDRAKFALDLMRRRQQVPKGLATQDKGVPGLVFYTISGVGLPVRKFAIGRKSRKSFDILAQPAFYR